MKRRHILAFCGCSLAGVTGCLSSTPQTEGDNDASGTNRTTPETDTSTPTRKMPATATEETPSPSSTPSPLVGGTVSAEPGDTVEIPFTVTNTGPSSIDPDSSPVLNVDLAYFPALSLATDASVPGTWSDDFEDWTTWTPPKLIGPGETITAQLPVSVDERARGLYAVRAEGQVKQISTTGTASLRVSPVSGESDIAVQAQGGLGGFSSTGPPGTTVIDEPVCPSDTARCIVYIRNVAETPIETATVALTLPEGWTVDEVTHADRWRSTDTHWRFPDIAPGRYRWSRVDLIVPSDISERTSYPIDVAGVIADNTERTASATVTVDPNKDSGVTEC